MEAYDAFMRSLVSSLQAAGFQVEYGFRESFFTVNGMRYSLYNSCRRGRPIVDHFRVPGGPVKGYPVNPAIAFVLRSLPHKIATSERQKVVKSWQEWADVLRAQVKEMQGVSVNWETDGVSMTLKFTSITKASVVADFYQDAGGASPDDAPWVDDETPIVETGATTMEEIAEAMTEEE